MEMVATESFVPQIKGVATSLVLLIAALGKSGRVLPDF